MVIGVVVLVAVGMAQTVCLEECFDMEQPCPYGEVCTGGFIVCGGSGVWFGLLLMMDRDRLMSR